MDWIQFSIFFFSMVGMWLSSRADWRKTDQKIEEHRKETYSMIQAIHQEIKDFHGRLCTIEERRK
ncbi:MAG TPA: hypothetical protein VKZ95_03710 [Sphingobacteriaceae bacterium]|nr:hypothetical protein [Sphingobacteriaceae bacterium]